MKKLIVITFAILLVNIKLQADNYTNYYVPGSEWTVETVIPTLGINQTIYKAEKNVMVDGKDCVIISISEEGNNNYKEEKTVAIENDKLLLLFRDANDNYSWKLLFDFGLKPESSIDVALYIEPEVISTVKYLNSGMCADNPSIPFILVGEAPPNQIADVVTEYDTMTWLPGIGSTCGPFENAHAYLTGSYVSRLIQVTHDGTIVYKAKSLKVDSIEDCDNKQNIIYDIYGKKVMNMIPGNIYIKNGCKIFKK